MWSKRDDVSLGFHEGQPGPLGDRLHEQNTWENVLTVHQFTFKSGLSSKNAARSAPISANTQWGSRWLVNAGRVETESVKIESKWSTNLPEPWLNVTFHDCFRVLLLLLRPRAHLNMVIVKSETLKRSSVCSNKRKSTMGRKTQIICWGFLHPHTPPSLTLSLSASFSCTFPRSFLQSFQEISTRKERNSVSLKHHVRKKNILFLLTKYEQSGCQCGFKSPKRYMAKTPETQAWRDKL